MCNVSSRRRPSPPWGGFGGGNANFLSLNKYFTLSFMLTRFFWLLQFYVFDVFTEKITILVENAFFPAFSGFCFEILMKLEYKMRTALKIDAIFEKSISKIVGVWISPAWFFFYFSSFVLIRHFVDLWRLFCTKNDQFSEVLFQFLKWRCSAALKRADPL